MEHTPRIEALDLSNPAEIAEFERAFYDAFAPLTHNRLIRRLWEWEETAGRLRTRVPYQEQAIFVQRDPTGAIEKALAVGVVLRTLQSSFFGFDLPRNPGNCEALAIFGRGKRRLGDLSFFGDTCRALLTPRDLTMLYGTCAPKVLPVQLWVGGELLETREIDGETRHFFRHALHSPPVRSRREATRILTRRDRDSPVES